MTNQIRHIDLPYNISIGWRFADDGKWTIGGDPKPLRFFARRFSSSGRLVDVRGVTVVIFSLVVWFARSYTKPGTDFA